MGRIIEAKAVISAEDRTGKVLDGIARKFKDVGKGAKAHVEVGKLAKQLDAAQAGLKGIERFRSAQATFGQARQVFRATQVEVGRIAKELEGARKAAAAFDGIKAFSKNGAIASEIAAARKQVGELERQFTTAQRAAKAASASYESQAAALKGAKRDYQANGGSLGKLVADQKRLQSAIEGTNAAILRQEALIRAESRVASGMGEHGRRAAARIAQGRHLTEGMSQPARQARAAREAQAREAAEIRAQRAADRREAGGTILAGGGIYAAHKSRQIAKDSIEAAGEFDIAVRKQQAFTDVSDADQAPLLSQAKKIGQETQFSNIDVVKAQTAAMQGLPASFAPRLKAEVAEGIVGNVRDFATLMETDLKEGSEIIRGYLQQSGRDISTKEKALKEANKATNQLVKTAKLGGMDGDDIKNYANYAVSSASTIGLAPEDILALGALARRGGLRGDVGGVAVRSMASKIVAPTADGLAALNAAGIRHSDYVKMPDKLGTGNLEAEFQRRMGKSFTPTIRKRLDEINSDKALIGDKDKYVEAVTTAVGDILGKTKKGTVRASDSNKAAKVAGKFHTVSAQSVDAMGLLDAAFKKGMTLPQLNAWLTDKHGGKAAVTQRQWDEFHTAREQIRTAGDDPEWAKKKADHVWAGVGGSIENFRGSIANAYLTIGNANAPLIKSAADTAGKGLDAFSNLSQGAQQGLSLGAGLAATGAGMWGSLKLLKLALGIGGNTVAGGGSVAAGGAAAGAGAGAAAAGATTGAATAGSALAVGGLATGVLAGGVAAAVFANAVTKNKNFAQPYLDNPLLGADPAGYGFGAGILHAGSSGGWRGSLPPGAAGMPGPAPARLPGLDGRPAMMKAEADTAARELAGFTAELANARGQLAGLRASGEYSSSPETGGLEARISELSAKIDASGQRAALNNTLNQAANNSATAANGGQPLTATVRPDQITARVESLPPISGSADVNVQAQVHATVTLNEPMLNAKIEASAGRAAAKMSLSSGGMRAGAASMPGAAATPGAAPAPAATPAGP